jgi:hypothetical protein
VAVSATFYCASMIKLIGSTRRTSAAALALTLASALLPFGAKPASAHAGNPAPIVASDFEGGGVDGWTSQYWEELPPFGNYYSQNAPASLKSSGGNPGGYYHIDGLQTEGTLVFVMWDSPTSWGDVSDAFGGTLELDLRGESLAPEVDFNSENIGLTKKLPAPTPGTDGWQHYSLRLDGESLGLPDSYVVEMLRTLESIRIRSDDPAAGEEFGLDNVGFYSSTPDDGDGVGIRVDNCKNDANADQANMDGDAEGDVCDADDHDGPLGDLDGDGTLNEEDADHSDGPLGDVDEDGDLNKDDNCRDISNADQIDVDADGVGDVCDGDDNDGPAGDLDGDGSSNESDTNDTDGPKGDPDGDGVLNDSDNCDNAANEDQTDEDGDGQGAACDDNDQDGPLGDLDGDGLTNTGGDECMSAAEDADGVMDGDGCPDKEVPTDATIGYAERPDRIKGGLSSKSGGCEAKRDVILYKAKTGRDAKLASAESTKDGDLGFDLDGRRGKFYVKVGKEILPPNGAGRVVICEAASSNTMAVK